MGTRAAVRTSQQVWVDPKGLAPDTRPLLHFDFSDVEDTGPRAALGPTAKPNSIKEAIIRWLEQQL